MMFWVDLSWPRPRESLDGHFGGGATCGTTERFLFNNTNACGLHLFQHEHT